MSNTETNNLQLGFYDDEYGAKIKQIEKANDAILKAILTALARLIARTKYTRCVVVQYIMNREVAECPIPPAWQLIQFNPAAIAQVHGLLQTVSAHLQAISKIKDYAEGDDDINEFLMRVLSNEELKQDCLNKSNELKDLARTFIPAFEQVQTHQRQVSLSFIRIARKEMEWNIDQLRRVQDEPFIEEEQYFLYIRQSLLQSLSTLRYFVQQQRDVSQEYWETKTFLRSVVPDRYNLQFLQGDEPDTYVVIDNNHIQSGLDNNPNESISHQLNVLLGQIKQQLKNLEEANLQELASSNLSKFVMAVGLLLLAACLGGVVYSFSIFDDYSRLGDDQLGWQGAGAYLIYLWLNYWLANICQERQVDVLLGTGCKSAQDIFFLSSGCIFLLLGLTLAYLLLIIVYLLWACDQAVWLAMNGLILGVASAELVYRLIKMRNIPAFASKLSMLHFLTLFLPINDIIGSLLQLQRNETMAAAIYLVFLCLAAYCQQRRKSIIGQAQWTTVFICVVSITILTQLVAAFLNDPTTKEKVVWGCTALNFIALCCFNASKADPLSPRQFFIDLKTIFTCCCATIAAMYRLRMNQANSYSRIVKALLGIIAISFLVILPFGIHWSYIEPYIGLHRYIYVAVLIGGYFAWSLLYLTEISSNLKHPLGNCTRLQYSLALLRTVRPHRRGQIQFDLEALDRRGHALKKLDQIIKTHFSQNMEKLRKVVAQLEDNSAYCMVAP